MGVVGIENIVKYIVVDVCNDKCILIKMLTLIYY